jgi:hypothetical protein
MGKRKKAVDGDVEEMNREWDAMGEAMMQYADRDARLEPVMLRLARIGGMYPVEKHILNVRKIVATRRQTGA